MPKYEFQAPGYVNYRATVEADSPAEALALVKLKKVQWILDDGEPDREEGCYDEEFIDLTTGDEHSVHVYEEAADRIATPALIAQERDAMDRVGEALLKERYEE